MILINCFVFQSFNVPVVSSPRTLIVLLLLTTVSSDYFYSCHDVHHLNFENPYIDVIRNIHGMVFTLCLYADKVWNLFFVFSC